MTDISTVQTVLGPRRIEDLGRTLFHEHIYVAFPGSELDPNYTFDRKAFLELAARRIKAVQGYGVSTFIDPLPIELGRDVDMMADLSAATGLNIICATGFYTEKAGLPFYWKIRRLDEVAELFIHEIEQGIGERKIKPGVIKCATGAPQISPQERKVLQAGAAASLATGLPILTHTDAGLCGPEQQEIFAEAGVPAHRVVIGHSCGNGDPAYHRRIVEGGSYIGFDRIGILYHISDEVRADCLAKLIHDGFEEFVLISQDMYSGWNGKLHFEVSPEEQARIERMRAKDEWPRHQTHLFENFIPMMEARGISREKILGLLDTNPIKFLSGVVPKRR